MSQDYIAIANITLKEYILPASNISQSRIEYLMADWFLSSAALYLMTQPHKTHLPKGDYGVLYSGGWQQNEIIWVSDYDAIYDGNAAWKADWKNQYYNALGQSAL